MDLKKQRIDLLTQKIVIIANQYKELVGDRGPRFTYKDALKVWNQVKTKKRRK